VNPTKIAHSTYDGHRSLCGVDRAEMLAAYTYDAPSCPECVRIADERDAPVTVDRRLVVES
jgi:hypothetical protein